jgi:putative acetyltransferase
MLRVYLDSQYRKRTKSHMDTTILEAAPADLAQIRELFLEYAQWLGEDLCFQGFDGELAGLPGDYAGARGALFIARSADAAGNPAGCIALRPFDETTGEIKRLYVRPEFRGTGLGRKLAVRALEAGRSAGYERLVLDTLDRMGAAVKLYRGLGFRPIPAYYNNPIRGALYFELSLDARMR